MNTDSFSVLLEELGKELSKELGGALGGHLALHPDRNNSCLIHLKEGINIQLEIDSTGEFLILGCMIGKVPAGKYRENLFKEALKANDADYPTHGIFAYSKKEDELLLFQKIHLTDLSGVKLASMIDPFAAKGLIWIEAVKGETIPSATNEPGVRTPGSGLFGL